MSVITSCATPLTDVVAVLRTHPGMLAIDGRRFGWWT
jgi:hypothetical protein